METLTTTQTQLEKTTIKLEVTEKTLEKTQTKLSKTIQQRDEQTHLVNQHVVCEKQLQKQAKSVCTQYVYTSQQKCELTETQPEVFVVTYT